MYCHLDSDQHTPAMTTKPGKISKSPLQLKDGDLLGQLTGKEGSALWLGRFTVAEIQQALEQYGVLGALRRKGLDNFIINIEPFEEFAQALRIYCKVAQPENLIAETRLREVHFTPQVRMQETFSLTPPKMLAIDWLLMQNPFAAFSAERPPLPGQTHPGLGQARRVVKLLIILCRTCQLAGILNFPEFFHNAYLYHTYFHFYDPRREGNMHALHRDLSPLHLAEMSWAIEAGCVRDEATGERLGWVADVQILPVQPALRDYFTSSWYRQRVMDSRDGQSYALDKEAYRRFREEGKKA